MGMLRYKYRVADKLLELIRERGTEEVPLTSGVMADILRADGVPIGAMTSALANMVKVIPSLHRRKVSDPEHSNKAIYGYWINTRKRNKLAKGPGTTITSRRIRAPEVHQTVNRQQFAEAVKVVNAFKREMGKSLELMLDGGSLRAVMMQEFK